MSRIRSIHPGLWTDENFVTLSPMARLLFMGIWTECDDGGAFEWRPLRLKMRILPADSIDIDALLSELITANCVCHYTSDGTDYGGFGTSVAFSAPKSPITSAHSRRKYGIGAEMTAFQRHRIPNRWGTKRTLMRNRFGTSSPPVGKFLRRREEGRKGGR